MDVLPPPPPRPPGCGDPIAETLELAGARCVLTRGFTFAGAWALVFPAPGRLKIHAVIEGVTWLVMEEIGKPLLLEAGGAVVFAGDRRCVLASDPDLTPVEALPLLKATTEPYHHTGAPGVREAVALGGHTELEAVGKNLLLGAQPPVMHMRASTTEAPAACWLLNQAFHEMREERVIGLLRGRQPGPAPLRPGPAHLPGRGAHVSGRVAASPGRRADRPG
ncbi:cupin domain-containing protein [Streptomyces sp. NPDC050848]|uniref:cupin domain-containing protein n=1 Tax=Streptomyces sp. NPDC050848 TaxID=3155791 RepID=UPI0033CE1B57